MSGARTRVALALAALAALGCKGGEMPELSGGAEMALRRGAAWSTVKVRPPYAIGPRVNLHFSHGRVTGHIDSDVSIDNRFGSLNAPPTLDNRIGGVNLTITEEGIQGEGPYGAVAIDVYDTEDGVAFDGTWNGARVNFKFTADAMKGSIPIRRFGRADSVGNVTTCQYVLDRVAPDGAREGTSICSGLPEPTRLEVPRQVEAWLTRKEMVVVLLALLSTPPQTTLEPPP